MIALLIVALAFSATALTYGASPGAAKWFDAHVRAIHAAFTAHRTADTKLAQAQNAKDPMTAVQLVHEARAANQEAARETADVAKTAKTDAQREAAKQNSDQVLDREVQIVAELDKLGVGQCDVKTYKNVTAGIKDTILTKLHERGMTVTGDNPWNVDTKEHGVKLRALWDPRAQEVKLIVAAGKGTGWTGIPTCRQIWNKVDPILRKIISSP